MTEYWVTNAAMLEEARTHAQYILQECEAPEIGHLEALAKLPSCWTAKERLMILTSAGIFSGSREFYELLGSESIDQALFLAHNFGQPSLFHLIATSWARDFIGNGRSQGLPTSTWWTLMEQGIRAGADINAFTPNRMTPFGVFLDCIAQNRLSQPIQLWAEGLRRAGVDLQQYGAIEHNALVGAHPRQNQIFRETYGIFEFAYGVEPSDWNLWYYHPGDIYAATFWALIEYLQYRLPGAWIDEDEEDENFDRTGRHRRDFPKRRTLRRIRSELNAAKRDRREPTYDVSLFANLCSEVKYCSRLSVLESFFKYNRRRDRIEQIMRELGI